MMAVERLQMLYLSLRHFHCELAWHFDFEGEDHLHWHCEMTVFHLSLFDWRCELAVVQLKFDGQLHCCWELSVLHLSLVDCHLELALRLKVDFEGHWMVM